MPRIHLFEFEDQHWFPTFLRNYMTDFLQFVANQFDFYKAIIPVLKKGLDKSGTNTIIDLASGGGGGWQKLSQHIKIKMPGTKVTLTDYYPNLDAFENLQRKEPTVFYYEKDPVSALDVPKKLKGLRTQFLSLHHFKPDDAKQILQNAVDTKTSIAIFEAQQRSLKYFIQFFFSPINVLLVTPFIRPFKWGRLFFTYLIPLVPLFVFWDGLVSVLRTYSPKELQKMTDEISDKEKYCWEIGEKKNGPVTIYYMLGYPRS